MYWWRKINKMNEINEWKETLNWTIYIQKVKWNKKVNKARSSTCKPVLLIDRSEFPRSGQILEILLRCLVAAGIWKYEKNTPKFLYSALTGVSGHAVYGRYAGLSFRTMKVMADLDLNLKYIFFIDSRKWQALSYVSHETFPQW